MQQQEMEQRVAQLRGSRPWTEGEARLVLEACDCSGETVPQFAQRMQLVPQRLWWWRKRLSQRPEPSSGLAKFLPLVVRPPEAAGAPSAAAAVLVCGEARLEVRELSSATAAWMACVLKALQEGAP